jgi:hypothetical protein
MIFFSSSEDNTGKQFLPVNTLQVTLSNKQNSVELPINGTGVFFIKVVPEKSEGAVALFISVNNDVRRGSGLDFGSANILGSMGEKLALEIRGNFSPKLRYWNVPIGKDGKFVEEYENKFTVTWF